ncbi:hypothetical protein J2X98_001864 [Pseudarthrobacter enclensis]|uniref:Uncharacterized protein n=1 Tax=Pseudarthrobacter enclensis TaxID=993070 RepID=A0ABT9RSQ4_9MICC|nr:hypothetical protein [Pseudarthrobacter enclensis]
MYAKVSSARLETGAGGPGGIAASVLTGHSQSGVLPLMG